MMVSRTLYAQLLILWGCSTLALASVPHGASEAVWKQNQVDSKPFPMASSKFPTSGSVQARPDAQSSVEAAPDVQGSLVQDVLTGLTGDLKGGGQQGSSVLKRSDAFREDTQQSNNDHESQHRAGYSAAGTAPIGGFTHVSPRGRMVYTALTGGEVERIWRDCNSLIDLEDTADGAISDAARGCHAVALDSLHNVQASLPPSSSAPGHETTKAEREIAARVVDGWLQARRAESDRREKTLKLSGGRFRHKQVSFVARD
ncbi:unnamed protein product [Parajaminaea phylloscopi]